MRIDLLVYRVALAVCLLCLAVSCYWNYRIRCDVQQIVREQTVANQKLSAARYKSGYLCIATGAGAAAGTIFDLGTLPDPFWLPPMGEKERK